MNSLKAKYMAEDASSKKFIIEESLMMQDNDKPKGNNVAGPSVVNMVEHNNSSRYNHNKGKRKHYDNTKAYPNKKSKVTCWKCGNPGQLKRIGKGGKDYEVAWWVTSGGNLQCWEKIDAGFLSQRESGAGRGVKEKQVSMANKSVEVSKHVNVALGSNSATPNVVNTGLKAFITISEAYGIHSHASANEENINDVGIINNVANNGTTMGPNPADNTPGMSTSYVNVTGEPSRKALNFCTLFTSAGNGVDVVVSVESIKAISERFSNMTYGFFFGKTDGLPR
ncbi:hypothetical protein Tco_0846116, partial [Tanacetum coccineum]